MSASTGCSRASVGAHAQPRGVAVDAVEDAVDAGEVDPFEGAGGGGGGVHHQAVQAVPVDPDEFAGGHVADEAGAHREQGARFGRQHVRAAAAVLAVPLADHEGADAVRVAEPDELRAAHEDAGVPALELLHGGGGGFHEVHVAFARDEVQHDFAVVGGGEQGAFHQHGAPDFAGVDEVAVVREAQDALVGAGGERLGVEAQVAAGGAVPDVPDADAGVREAQAVEAAFVEHLRDEAQVLLDVEFLAVADADACRFLAPVLHGEDAEVRHPGEVGGLRGVHAEHAALLAGLVEVRVLQGVMLVPLEFEEVVCGQGHPRISVRVPVWASRSSLRFTLNSMP